MKKYFFAAFIGLAVACNDVPKQEEKTTTAVSEIPKPTASRYASLLEQYESLGADTLTVFSITNITNRKFKFTGKTLDSASIQMLPKALQQNTTGHPGFYACYKFSIDNEHTGLITRMPSMYVPSSIKLLLFDHKADSITQYTELAELWGDAGDVYDKRSFLHKDSAAQWQASVWVQQRHDELNASSKTATRVVNKRYELGIRGNSIDTVRKTE